MKSIKSDQILSVSLLKQDRLNLPKETFMFVVYFQMGLNWKQRVVSQLYNQNWRGEMKTDANNMLDSLEMPQVLLNPSGILSHFLSLHT